MTWGEFKQKVEAEGVKDSHDLRRIDVASVRKDIKMRLRAMNAKDIKVEVENDNHFRVWN